MKKIIASALALTTCLASAAGTSVGITYDFDTQHELKGYVAQESKLGTFDAGLLGLRFKDSGSHNATGVELGYSNGFSFQQFGIFGRVAVGHLSSFDVSGRSVTFGTGDTHFPGGQYYSAGVEGRLPIPGPLNGFVGFRHRGGLDTDTIPAQNRFAFGADYAITKNINLRAGFARSYQGGTSSNGVATGVSLSF